MSRHTSGSRNWTRWFAIGVIALVLAILGAASGDSVAAQEPTTVVDGARAHTNLSVYGMCGVQDESSGRESEVFEHARFDAVASGPPGPDPAVCSTDCLFGSIQTAIDAAAEGATLTLGAETFTESFTVDKSLTIQGAGAGGTIVQAAASPGVAPSRVVTVTEGVSVTLDGLTIRYGNTSGVDLGGSGGGILNMGALTVSHCTVYSNTASYEGGGIHNDGDNRTAILRIISSTVMSNTAGSVGGGIRNYAYLASGVAVADLVASDVISNSAGTGGGVSSYANLGTAVMTITHSTVHDNSASTHGGGIDISSNQAGGAANILISLSTISENSAALSGGGIYVKGSNGSETSLDMSSSTVRGNSADDGGGLANVGYTASTGRVAVTGCTFTDNSATQSAFSSGGGLYNAGSGSSTVSVEIESSTFNANIANYNGGGVINNGSATITATMSISRSTFSGNSASGSAVAGGGIHNYEGTLSVVGTIAANSPSGKDCYDSTNTMNDNGHNLMPNNHNCALISGSDPMVEPLADNGGPTWTHALQSGSPALDAIPTGSCGAATDQRGVLRPQSTGCDIGAYEAVSEAWVDDDWTGQADVEAYDPELSWGANAFDNVSQAVNAVVGSTVHVLAGTYTETLTLDKNVTVIGEDGAADTIIQAAGAPGIAASRVVTVTSGVSVTLDGLTVRHGRATGDGGGILNEGTLTLTHSTVISNVALALGGGIYSGGASDTRLVVHQSTVTRNFSNGDGGGIINDATSASAYLSIEGGTVAANTAATSGGGLINRGGSGTATATVEQSTFSGNSATFGGGIFNTGAAGPAILTLVHSTLSDNTASTAGGGLGNLGAAATLIHSIVANSVSSADCGNGSGGTVTDGGYNLVENDGNCGLGGSSDPRLEPLQDNGGPTWTHALQSGSPALDAIPLGICTATTDQRGYARPKGSGCDIGAYEAVTEAWVDDDWVDQDGVNGYDPSLVWGSDAFGAVGDGLVAVSSGTIHVLTGTYTETLTIDKSVEIVGQAGAENTILQAAGLPGIATNRVITVAEGVTVTLDGITIRNGYANGSGAGYSRDGGGIYNMGVLTVTNSIVRGNAATRGGGIVNAGAERHVALTIDSSQVVSNTAASRGGGIYNETDIDGLALLTMSNSTVSWNAAQFVGGGLLAAGEYGASIIGISATTFAGNSAGEGAGIYNYCEAADAGVLIAGSTFSDNIASDVGGAIYNYAYEDCTAPIQVFGSLFSGNSAQDLGGGIYNYAEGTLASAPVTILNSTLAGNTALDGDGGGIHNMSYSGQASITLSQSTLSGNSAPNGEGGGCYGYTEAFDGRAVVASSHSTIWGNSASGNGGGVRSVDATFAFSNTIIAGSQSGGDCSQNTGSTITDGGYNLVQDGSCVSDPSSFAAGPKLDLLKANGGPASGVGGQDPMLTHALLPTSPAIDAVPTGACPDAGDQRSTTRPAGFGCDIGAFEVDTFSLGIAKSVDDAAPEPGQTITFTIVVSNTGPGMVGALISDTLRAGLNYVGPISVDPPDAGSTGLKPPILAYGLAISANQQVTVAFPVTISYGLAGGTPIVNIAAAGSAQAPTPVAGSVRVTVANVPPVAVADGGAGFATDEDSAFNTGSVLANDSDANGDSLSVVGHVTGGTVGLVVDNGDGSFGYDPNGQFEDLAAGEQATDHFGYAVGDGHGGNDTATVTITIHGADEGVQVFLPVVLRSE